jgi:3',5'-cyclic AMP phosphodiesterase CpdA
VVGAIAVVGTFVVRNDRGATEEGIVVMAAGDIACPPGAVTVLPDACQHGATADLVEEAEPDAVFVLGDNQYEQGILARYESAFDATWGRFKELIHPTPGNHDYLTEGAAGYFSYFGAAAGDPERGYYSFDLDGWHIVVLNSNCEYVGGCDVGSPQEEWLRRDLATHDATCTLAYWHHPRFSSGQHGGHDELEAFWRALYEAGAEVVLTGHDHDYERFAPQGPNGRPDERSGIIQFVVGTGGKSLRSISTVADNSVVRNDTTYGVLRLTLRSDGYDWRFVASQAGGFTDSGSQPCH